MKKTVLIIVSMLLCLFGCQKDEPKEFNAGITSLEVVEDEGVWNFKVDVNDSEGKKNIIMIVIFRLIVLVIIQQLSLKEQEI